MNDKPSFKETVATVKQSYDIADYIQQSGVTLKRAGTGKHVGLCPFHNEKTPSFSVDDRFQSFRCFGCGVHGDIIGYVQKTEGLDFTESLRKLSEDKSIVLSFDNSESSVDYASLRAAIRDAANFFYNEFKKLPKEHEAVQQIVSRNLSLKKSMYGYAPYGNALYKHLSEKGYSDDTILEIGVCRKSDKGKIFDFWQGRLMFFILGDTGRVVGFSGRKLRDSDAMGKYVNSPDTPLFKKSSVLYSNKDSKKIASQEKEVYVAEGQFDVAALVESGISNAVAGLGTAFTEEQGNLCRRLVTHEGKIIFCFDGDEAGIKAATKVFMNIPSIHAQSYVVNFPKDSDPCDFLQEHGPESLAEFVKNNQKPMVEFILDIAEEHYDLDSPLGVNNYIKYSSRVLKTISSQTLREVFIRKVSLASFTSIDSIRAAIKIAEPLVKDAFEETNVSNDQNSDELVISEDSRPILDADEKFNQEEIIELIKTDVNYKASARLISLSLMDTRLIPHLVRSRGYLVRELHWVIDDLEGLDEKSIESLVAESFTYSSVMNYIMTNIVFPVSVTDNKESIKEQFIYLRKYLRKNVNTARKKSLYAKNSRILSESKEVGIDMLEAVINKEQKIIGS